MKRFLNRIENPFIAGKEERLARLIAAKFPQEGKSFLEIGCGEGSNIYFLKQELPDVAFTGIDFSPGKIAFLAAANLDVTSVCGDATAIPFKDASFDLVLCRDLLHHVDFSRDRVLGEALRVTRDKGVVVLIESDGRRFLNRLFRMTFQAERGMCNSFPEKLMELAAQFGRAELVYVEASFLVRALAFFLGWPGKGISQYIATCCYSAGQLWERAVTALIPKNRWTYMMITINKG